MLYYSTLLLITSTLLFNLLYVCISGLDIPQVDLVINFDLPKVSSDYVHRVGRTARAGRAGRSVSLITQYDVELVKSIEAYTGIQLTLSTDVSETDIVPLLNPVAKAKREAEQKLLEVGFDTQLDGFKKKKKRQKRKQLRKVLGNMKKESISTSV